MKKPVGYVASPYTKGDPCINTNFQCRVFDRMMNDGIVIPYIPLWSHFQHTAFPRHYEDWIEYDNAMIGSLDLRWILRLNATHDSDDCTYFESRSSGADNEVELVKKLYPEAIIVVQRDSEQWEEALERLYVKLNHADVDDAISILRGEIQK